MTESSFWRDLETQFRAIPNRLHARRQYLIGSRDDGGWELTGASDSLRAKFEVLAKRAAAKAVPGGSNLLAAWLTILKRENRNSFPERYICELNSDGTKGPSYLLERIERICELSANLC
jgi:hypothetical protein